METKRKKRKNPTLIALIVLLPLAIWGIVEFRSMLKYGPTVEPGQAPRLSEYLGITAEDVTRVEMASGANTTVLSKSGKEWRLEKPTAARADASVVDQMLKDLLDPNVDSVVAQEVKDLKPYGLDKPEVTITLTDRGGGRKVLQAGGKDVRGTAIYVREASRPTLFLLSSFAVENMKGKKADDLRDKTVLAIDPEKVNKITIAHELGTVVVERKGKEDWALTQPDAAPADKSDVGFYLTQLKDLKAEKFVAEQVVDLAKYGLAKPQLTVTVSGPQQSTLLLGKKVPGEQNLYAARGGEKQVFSVRLSALTDLRKSAGDLRDKTLLSFKRDDATKLALSTTAGSVEVQREGADWKVTKPFTGKAKTEKLDSIFFSLESVKGTGVAEEKPGDLAKYGLAQPEAKVSVWLKGQTAPRELLIGKKAAIGNGYYARSSAGPTVFIIPEFTLSDLKVKPNDLKG